MIPSDLQHAEIVALTRQRDTLLDALTEAYGFIAAPQKSGGDEVVYRSAERNRIQQATRAVLKSIGVHRFVAEGDGFCQLCGHASESSVHIDGGR